MMDDSFPKQPFCERHEFLARFSKNNEVAPNIHTVIQYSKIKPSEISGRVFGTKETYDQLTKIINQPGVSCKFESEVSKNQVILSEEVTFTNITKHGYGYNNMIYAVADLSFMKLTIEERYPEMANVSERHLTFFLSGPRNLWSVQMSKMPSLTGAIPAKMHNSTIDLNKKFPFSLEILPCHFYDKDTITKFDLTTSVMALHYKTNKNINQFSNEEFINLATTLTNDLILLVSFVSRRWIRWFRYHLETNKCSVTFLRRISECATDEPSWSLVEQWDARKFLKMAFTELRKLRSESFNLIMPLIYYISSNEAQYLEDKFAILFLALEKLKDLYASKKKLKDIVPKNNFKILESNLKNCIRQSILDANVRSLIYRKIPELNRPPLNSILDSMFSEYGIAWTDIYPQGSKYTFINTRDKLFHSTDEIDMELLAKEHTRLQVIVERILLILLGWNNLSRTLSETTKKWLITPNES